MKNILLLLFSIITIQSFAQITVNRKIGQRWDKYTNNTWQGQDSIVYNYNAFGLEANRFAEKGLANNAWLFNYRTTSTYDANQNLTSLVQENWTSNGWTKLTKYNYTYNANNLQTELIYQVWNTTSNAWRNNGRIVNTYTGILKTKLESYNWDGTTWQPGTRQLLSYNGSNELTIHTFFNFSGGLFNPVERRQYQYAYGFVSSYIRSTPDTAGNWELKSRTINLINGSATPARISSSTVESWDQGSNLWVDSLKSSYNYSNNLLSFISRERYNTSTLVWTSTSLTNYYYNASNLLIEEQNLTYSQSTSSYQNTLRKLFTYNTNNLNDQITFYNDNGNGGWKETARDQMNYNSNDSLIYRLNEAYQNNSFIANEQFFYHYAEVPVGLSDYNNLFSLARLYPNPSSQYIAIDTKETLKGASQANIYSTNGKRIWSQTNAQAIDQLKYDVSHLALGNYILQIIEISSGKTQHFKFSKK